MDSVPNTDATPVADVVAAKPSWGLALGSFSAPEQMAFIHRVYGWMCGGLVISAVVAYGVATTPAVAELIVGNMLVFVALLLAEVVAVIYLAKMVHKISSTVSSVIFLLYSALNGLTLSVIFFVYTMGSITEVFLITAGVFGVMSFYGYVTKRDLTTVGQFAFMALLGLLLATLLNLFFPSDTASLVFAYVGVLVFVALTAFDTQKLKWLYALGRTEGSDGEKKEAVNGALTLYLDFINLFLELLRIFGKRR
jgi:FtsH-binding integral membrane protein